VAPRLPGLKEGPHGNLESVVLTEQHPSYFEERFFFPAVPGGPPPPGRRPGNIPGQKRKKRVPIAPQPVPPGPWPQNAYGPKARVIKFGFDSLTGKMPLDPNVFPVGDRAGKTDA